VLEPPGPWSTVHHDTAIDGLLQYRGVVRYEIELTVTRSLLNCDRRLELSAAATDASAQSQLAVYTL